MPRTARKKSDSAMYHVICRSISEVDLFQTDDDKDYFLTLLKRYKERFHCMIYAYILMDNHVHIYINPCGADISTFMLCLNTAYVVYFNKKYNRHGHLFQGRFGSRIVYNNSYSLTLSAYIHNNAKDLPGYSGREEYYPYSSYGIYLGICKDVYGIVDTDFLLRQFGGKKHEARKRYKEFVKSMNDTDVMDEVEQDIMAACTENEYIDGKNYVIRDRAPEEVINRIESALGERLPGSLRLKYSREASNIRAFAVYVLRILCGFTYKKLCEYIGNMSISGISRLSRKGFNLYKEHRMYQDIFMCLLQTS